jgi:hypothetical protein
MKTTLAILLTLTCCLLVVAQERAVKIVRFEVDGKPLTQPFKISLTVRGKTTEAKATKDRFVVPSDLPESETVDVRFESGTYNLFFESVQITKFNTDWIFGIDTNPFEPENVESVEPDPPGKELSRIYYLSFHSKDGPDTRMIVKEFN